MLMSAIGNSSENSRQELNIVTETPIRTPWDSPSRADERRPAFAPEIIDAEYTVVRQRPALSFGWCVFIVTVAAIIVLRFAWKPNRLETSGVAGSPHRATANPLLISQFARTAPDDSPCRGSICRHTSYGQA